MKKLSCAFLWLNMASDTANGKVNFGYYPVDQGKEASKDSSVTYEANTNFQACPCDLTSDACDAFCCCDEKCSEATRQQWGASEQCTNVKYQKDVNEAYALMDCISAEEQYKFNSEKGLLTYWEPFVSNFCVMINNAPNIGKYYAASKSLPNQEEIEKIVSDPARNGFVGPLF